MKFIVARVHAGKYYGMERKFKRENAAREYLRKRVWTCRIESGLSKEQCFGEMDIYETDPLRFIKRVRID